MKSIVILLGLLALTSAIPTLPEMDHYLMEGYEQLEHKFGALHLFKQTGAGSDNIIVFPKRGFGSELEHYQTYHKIQLDRINNPINVSDAIEHCDKSDKPDFFKFIPTFVGKITPNKEVTYTAPCFQENSITLEVVDQTTVKVTLIAEQPSSELCADAYLFATEENFHFQLAFIRGTHTFTLTELSSSQFEEITVNGLNAFRFCDHLINELPDVLMTVELFLGGFGLNPNIPVFGSRPPVWMVDENIKFIKDATGYQWEPRPKAVQKTVYDIDPSIIQSGDFFAVTRFDGLDQIIEWGAGSHSGHSVVAGWVDEELYIFESQAAWYWPRKNIQSNPWKTWVEWANNAGFQVTWLPIKQEYAQQFDMENAFEWFKTVNNTPYGYHNFLFGWIDTADASYPPLLSPELLAPVFSLVEYISPFAAQEVFTLALNKRMNTTNLTVPQLADVIHAAGLTFPEVYAMVEQDSWVYPDGVSLVCSSFVAAFWRAGGLFGNLTIQATEFTPRDIYQTVFIDPTPVIPESCKSMDPVNPYCQIMGKYRMTFPGISTISPYNNMNDYCPSQPPEYFRPAGC